MNLTTAINRDYQVSRCSRNHSLSASFMRVCQPLPVALKASSTSASKRTVVETLVGDFCLPRPDNLIFSDSGNSENGLNNAGSTFDKSPTSPSLSISGNRETMGSSFSFVSFAKTDDTNAALSLAERQHMQPAIQVADGDKARFRVFNARVLPDFRGLKIKIDRAFKAQAAFSDVFGVLGGIEFNYHEFIVVTNSKMHKYFVTTFDKPSIRAYPSRTTDTSVVGIGVLVKAAIGRKVSSNAAFLLSQRARSLWADWAGAARPPVRFSGTPTCSVPPALIGVGEGGSFNELKSEHIMTTINSGAFAPVVFQFQSTNIRTFADDNGEPWFCANDVCEVLGYANSRQAVQKNCLEKGVSKRDTLTGGGNQELTFINEGNLYRLIVKSRKPEAEKFEQQVMDEILPAIRKTGSYQHKQESLPAIDVNQIEKLIQKQLQKSLPVNMAHDCLLPPQQAKEITDRLNRLASMFHPCSDQFLDVMGVIRALHGRNPKLGLEQPGYRKVMTSTLK